MLAPKLRAESLSTLNHQDDFLRLKNAHGVESASSKCISFLNQSTILCIVGCNLFTIDIENVNQSLITLAKCKGRIDLFELTQDKSFVLLVDIEYKNSNLILMDLKDLNRKKVQRTRQIENEIVKSVSISINRELIACLTSAPDSNLILFSTSRLNLLAKIKIQTLNEATSNLEITNTFSLNPGAEEVTFLPNDNKRLIVIGNRFVKMFLYTKNALKQISSLDCNFYLYNFAWLNKNEFIAYDYYGNLLQIDPKQNSLHLIQLKSLSLNDLDESELSLSEKDQFDLLLSSTNNNNNNNHNYQNENSLLSTPISQRANTNCIKCLVCVRKGFFISYENQNKCCYYELNSNEMFTYTLTYTIQLRVKGKFPQVNKSFNESITNLVLNPEKLYLVAVTNKKSIYYYDLNELFSNRKNTAHFELLIDGYHHDTITGVDVCLRKPLVASCSLDRWLILWNFDTNQLELKQNFDEDLLSVAIHPSGSYLILSTANTMKYMAVYMNSLKIVHVLYVRSCSNCLFAHGGHMFAFVHGTVVQIYSSLCFNELGSIKTQEMGKIKQLRFSKNDHYLLCCSMAGIIRIWNAKSFQVVSEIVTKGLSYIGLGLHPNNEWLFCISTEKAVRQFQLPLSEEHNFLIKQGIEAKLLKKYETKSDENITCIEINRCGKIVCVGTNKGSLRVYLTATGASKDFRAHSSSICKLCITHTDEYVISCSEDGAVFYWQIDSRLRDHNSLIDINQSNEEILIDQDEYLKQVGVIKQFEEKLSASKEETRFMLRFKDLKFEMKKRELESRFDLQINDLKNQIETSYIEDQENENDFNSKYDAVMRQYFLEFDQLSAFHERKFQIENENYNKLLEKIDYFNKEIELNSKTIEEIENNTDLIDHECSEENSDLISANIDQEIKVLDRKIIDLLEFETDLENDLRSEILNKSLSFENSLLDSLRKTASIENDLNNFRADCSTLRLTIDDEYRSSIKCEYGEIETLIEKQKALKKLETKLSKDLENIDKLILVQENEIKDSLPIVEATENEISALKEKIEFVNENFVFKLEQDCELFKTDLNQIQNEIKLRKLENFKLQVDCKRFKQLKSKKQKLFESLLNENKKICELKLFKRKKISK